MANLKVTHAAGKRVRISGNNVSKEVLGEVATVQGLGWLESDYLRQSLRDNPEWRAVRLHRDGRVLLFPCDSLTPEALPREIVPCGPCAEGYCQDCQFEDGEPETCGCGTCAEARASMEELHNGLSDFFSGSDPENWVGWYIEEPMFVTGGDDDAGDMVN